MAADAGTLPFMTDSVQPVLPGTLTRDEALLVETLVVVNQLFLKIMGKANTRQSDYLEAVIHIHALQNMVLAQSAARAYPKEFRLLGEVLEDER